MPGLSARLRIVGFRRVIWRREADRAVGSRALPPTVQVVPPSSLAGIRSKRRSNPPGANGQRTLPSPVPKLANVWTYLVRTPTFRDHRYDLIAHLEGQIACEHVEGLRVRWVQVQRWAGIACGKVISTTPSAPSQSASPSRIRNDSPTAGRRITPRPVVIMLASSFDHARGLLSITRCGQGPRAPVPGWCPDAETRTGRRSRPPTWSAG